MSNIPAATSPLTLSGVKLGPISRGAYVIGYSGHIPIGATLLLGVPDEKSAIDVTHQKHDHLIDDRNFSRFLALVGNADWWGGKGRCRLFLKHGRSITLASNEVFFDCPVKPLVSKPNIVRPTLGISHSELNSLSYAGDNDHGAFGRYLHFPAIDGCFYFRNGHTGFLETENRMRGLVCTSYIGAIWNIHAALGGPLTWTGTAIASCSGAPFYCVNVGINDRPLDEVKAYLEKHNDATLLVGSKNHIVLVVRGSVHDFTIVPLRGYNSRPIKQWKGPHHHKLTDTWTVGKPQLQL